MIIKELISLFYPNKDRKILGLHDVRPRVSSARSPDRGSDSPQFIIINKDSTPADVSALRDALTRLSAKSSDTPQVSYLIDASSLQPGKNGEPSFLAALGDFLSKYADEQNGASGKAKAKPASKKKPAAAHG